MPFLIWVLVSAAGFVTTTHAASTGRNAVLRSCERALFRSHARASDAFRSRALEILDAGPASVDDARWIGQNVLRYPEFVFASARRNVVSRLADLMKDPVLAEVFFGAHEDNALVVSDLIAITPYARFSDYQFLQPHLERLVTTRPERLARAHPGFDVVSQQAAAIVVAKWAGLTSSALVECAVTFVDPPRRHWIKHRWSAWRDQTNDPYGYRATAAAHYLRVAMTERRLPKELVDRLVASAAEMHHPHQSELWEAFAIESLAPEQVERLRELWHGLTLSTLTRRWLRHSSPELTKILDQTRSNATL